MNKERRAKICNIISMLESILSEEQNYFDNMPENLLGSFRGSESEDAIDYLQEAIESLGEIC